MTFKEKHLLPLMMSAVVLTSCGDVKNPFNNNEKNDNMGLLDDRPQKDNDKYGTKVLLYQVSVPVYSVDGKRLENKYILTRGLQESSYESASDIENMSIKPVYLNGSEKVSYVKADDNNAIYTEKGFCGLFIDYNKKAVVIADRSLNQFITGLGIRLINKTTNTVQNRNYIHTKTTAVDDSSLVADAVTVKDSVTLGAIDNNATDSMKSKPTFSEKQFLDTMQVLRQKEL